MDFELLIWVLFAGYMVYVSLKMVYGATKSFLMLKKAKKNGGSMIRCNNAGFRTINYLFPIGIEVFLVYSFHSSIVHLKSLDHLSRLEYLDVTNASDETVKYTVVLTIFYVLTICPAVNLLIHLVALLRERSAYLTEEGIIYYLGHFRFSECNFVWDAANGSLSNVLHVYKGKKKMPYTVYFDAGIEEAHRMTEKSINGFNNSFVDHNYLS